MEAFFLVLTQTGRIPSSLKLDSLFVKGAFHIRLEAFQELRFYDLKKTVLKSKLHTYLPHLNDVDLS